MISPDMMINAIRKKRRWYPQTVEIIFIYQMEFSVQTIAKEEIDFRSMIIIRF